MLRVTLTNGAATTVVVAAEAIAVAVSPIVMLDPDRIGFGASDQSARTLTAAAVEVTIRRTLRMELRVRAMTYDARKNGPVVICMSLPEGVWAKSNIVSGMMLASVPPVVSAS